MRLTDSTPKQRLLKIQNDTGMRKNNFNASSAPDAENDASQGYEVGSRWIYNGEEYVCVDPSAGAADWRAGATQSPGAGLPSGGEPGDVLAIGEDGSPIWEPIVFDGGSP